MTLNDYQHISILDVAARLSIEVKKNKAICFLHDEKTPSLTFHEKKGVYYCHGCGAKGNVFTLVRTILKLDSKQTHEWLRVHYLGGYSNMVFPKSPIINKISKEKIEEEYFANPEIYDWLIQETSLSKEAKNYLVNVRGFSEATIQKLKIRDIQKPYDFYRKLELKWGQEQLLKCGLLKHDDKGNVKPIWWDHVIIFPFFDLKQQATYLQARRMCEDGKSKYLNLKGIRKEIYNLNCITQMNPGEKLFICEGIPDTITMIEKGVKTIGVLGAHGFDEKYVPLLLDYTIYIIPDADLAGGSMVKKVVNSFKKVDKDIKLVKLPDGKKDVNELHTTNNRN